MTSVIMGIVFIVTGSWGLLYWAPDFLVVVRGLGPISMFVGGLVSLMVGISALRPKRVDEDKD